MVNNISFDIDHTCAFHSISSFRQGKFIREKGAILPWGTLPTHYIYPGITELVRLLILNEQFKVSFISKGSADRNYEFVRLFLSHVIPEPEHVWKKGQVRTRVLSREDLVEMDFDEQMHHEFYGIWPSDTLKDISKILSGRDLLEDAVLIDDRADNATSDQVANLLIMPFVDSSNYDALIEKNEFYDESGMRYLKCMLSFDQMADLEEGLVEDGRRIIVYKKGDFFEIKFIDLMHVVQCGKVTSDTSLFNKLNSFYEECIEYNVSMSYFEDQETIKGICDFVEELNGRTKKICRQANRVCYVAGLLFSALSLAKEYGVPLSHALFRYQYTLNEDQKTYRSNFAKLVKDDRFYHIGLEKLKEVNKNFQFITPHSYNQYLQTSLSLSDLIFYKAAVDYQFK